jgi:uncharacterized surface protein with fasciclin (FAS1) repeats
MKTQLIMVVALAAILGCEDKPAGGTPGAASGAASATAAAETAKVEAPRAPRPDNQKTVVDVALGSKDHTTLVTALKAADLVESLDSPGGVYTVFAPTNAAFDKLPAGTVAGLLKPEKKDDLKNILQHHAGVPIMQLKDMKDGQTMAMADGTKVTFHVKDGKYMVNDANIVASVNAMNGIVHVIDGVLLPPAK